MRASEITRELLRKVAKQREELHTGQQSSRPLSDGYEYIGLVGEWQFSLETGLEMDLGARPKGDFGIDFLLPSGDALDVKTARKAYNLIVEKGHVYAGIYVLAQYDDKTDSAELLGWEYGADMDECPSKDFGYKVINHYKSVGDLRPMKLLIDWVKK